MKTQSWDTALKGDPSCDYSSCTDWLFEDGKHYLIDVFREQLDFPELRRKALEWMMPGPIQTPPVVLPAS